MPQSLKPPYLTMAAFCRRVSFNEVGVPTLHEVVDVIEVDPPERDSEVTQEAHLQAVIAFKSDEATGPHALEWSYRDPLGREMKSGPASLSFDGSPQGHAVINNVSVPIRQAGTLWMSVWLDGELVTKVPLHLLFGPTKPGRSSRGKKSVKRKKRPKKWTREAIARLDNDELLEAFSTAMSDRTDLRAGELRIANRVEKGAPPEAIEILLKEAGSRGMPLPWIAERVVGNARSGLSFISDLVAPTSWKRYEIHAAHALVSVLKKEVVAFGEAVFDARILGRSGQKRQVDLLLRRDEPRHHVACEIKEYPNRRVQIEVVEAFASKLKDVSADKGVLITPCGYSEGAIAVAKREQIALYRFRETDANELRERTPEYVAGQAAKTYWILERPDGACWVFGGTVTEAARATTKPAPRGPEQVP